MQHLAAPLVTGNPRRWALDYALVGASSGFFALMGLAGPVVLVPALVAGLVGGVSGALLGRLAPHVLDRLRRHVPVAVIALLGVPIGFAWGALAGAAAAAVLDPWLWELMIAAAGIAGALQLGWLWFPYTFQSVVQGRRWPLVATACLITPWLGYAAATVLGLILT